VVVTQIEHLERRKVAEALRDCREQILTEVQCFQMAELIERTARAAHDYGARCIVLTGFPDIFDDEEISPAEAKSVFTRALGVLHRWRTLRLAALAFSDLSPQPTPLRAWLIRRLAGEATAVYRLEETAAGLALRGGSTHRPQTRMSAPRKPMVSVGQAFLPAAGR
jgi:hypothetical protein